MAISTSITWKVTKVDKEISDNFIVAADYEVSGICTVTTGAASTTYGPVSEYDKVIFNTTRTGFEIEYNNITEDNVLAWVKTALSSTISIGPPEDRIEGIESELKEKDVIDHLMILYNRPQKSIDSGTPWQPS